MSGEAFFVPVTVVKVAETCGERTPMLDGTALRVSTLASGVVGRVIWEAWVLPYEAFLPFNAAVTAGAGFCCGATGLGANWLPE